MVQEKKKKIAVSSNRTPKQCANVGEGRGCNLGRSCRECEKDTVYE